MFCLNCFAENLHANFCFNCARPVSAKPIEFLHERRVETFGNTTLEERFAKIKNSRFVCRKNEKEFDVEKRLKASLRFISIEFAVILILNDAYNLFNLINLYRS